MHADSVPQAARVTLLLGAFNILVMAFVAHAVMTAPPQAGEALASHGTASTSEPTWWACPSVEGLRADLPRTVVMRDGCVPVVQF